MAIVGWPDDIRLEETVFCATCGKGVCLEEATAGELDDDGRQAFACNSHFLSGARLLVSWIEFATTEAGGE